MGWLHRKSGIPWDVLVDDLSTGQLAAVAEELSRKATETNGSILW